MADAGPDPVVENALVNQPAVADVAVIGGDKVPKTVAFAAALPRPPSGKVQKALLRGPHERGRSREVH